LRPIHYGRHAIKEEDIKAVVKTLKSDFIAQGPLIEKFEARIAHYCAVKYAIALSSGTAALHLASLAAGFKPKDEVITSAITFLATANSIIYSGARPVFCDIDYHSVNITAQTIKEKITPKTKGIIPVHFAGLPCDMKEIARVARKKHLVVIEDACHALGAEYNNSKIGCCKYSDMACFSFHPVKTITTGEGGVITTNKKSLYLKLKSLRNHGIHRDPSVSLKYGGWFYEMRMLGFNYRITDFQSALGLSQIKRIDEMISKRRYIAARYNQAFGRYKEFIDLPYSDSQHKSCWHLYVVKFNTDRLGITRREIYERLRKKGIYCQVHYIPVYKQPYYKKHFKSKPLKNAEIYYKRALSLPIFPAMSEEDISRVIGAVIKIIEK
jgi:UDP-4-amino-4,6-dideoxy-N-acetyl-beta-L-altrosamine transaminase